MKKKTEEASLAKSHSASSNAKLTLLCIFTVLSFSAFWVGLGLLGKTDITPNYVSYSLLIGGGVLTVLGLIGFNLFKR